MIENIFLPLPNRFGLILLLGQAEGQGGWKPRSRAGRLGWTIVSDDAGTWSPRSNDLVARSNKIVSGLARNSAKRRCRFKLKHVSMSFWFPPDAESEICAQMVD